MINIIIPMISALITVAFQAGKPDLELSTVFMSAVITFVFVYVWCCLVDWLIARGHNLP